MSNWTKLKDMNFTDIDYNCCDDIMANNSNQFYCKKYDIVIEHGGMEADAVSMFCAQYHKNNQFCWARMRCGAVIFKTRNERKDMIKLLDERIEKDPKDSQSYKNRAAFNAMIFTEMNNYRFSFNPSWVKVLEEHFDKEIKEHANIAISDYSTAIKLDSGDADVLALRGSMYAQIKNYAYALADFNKAIEIDDRCKNAYQFRGAMYSDKGEYDRAIADLEHALELSPNDEFVSFALKNAKKLRDGGR